MAVTNLADEWFEKDENSSELCLIFKKIFNFQLNIFQYITWLYVCNQQKVGWVIVLF